MKNIISLTKVFYKSSFKKDNEDNDKKKIYRKIGILVLFLYLAGIMGIVSFNLLGVLKEINQEGLFIGVYALTILTVMLIQTVFSSINIFYFSKDTEYVLPLPVKPIELLISKLNTLLITEYIIEIILGIAPMIIYGISTNAGYLYYLFSIFMLILLPLFPVFLALLLVMIIMSFSKLIKYKERFQFIVNILLIGIAIGIQFTANSMQNPSNEKIIEMVQKANGLIDIIGNYFLTLRPAVNMVLNPGSHESIMSLLFILGITIVSFIVFAFIGKKLYLIGLVGNKNGATKKIKNINKYFKRNSIITAYLKKEIKLLVRNPIYFIQCILPAVIIPILMIAVFLGTQQVPIEEIAVGIDINSTITICIIMAIINFMFSMNYIAITAISRDGENAYFVKYIPISLYKQFFYKILPAIIINIIPISMTIIIAKYIFKDFSIISILLVALMGFLINILQSMLMLIIDLKKPKLHWNSEYTVVKQNMNMIYEIGLMFLLIGTFIGIGFVLKEIHYTLVCGIIIFILLVTILIINKIICRRQERLFEKII